MSTTNLDIRQSELRAALNMAGTSNPATVDSILSAIDPLVSKLYADRNAILTDGGLITFNGSSVTFTENLKLKLFSTLAGGTLSLSLGNSPISVNNGDIIYAVIDRTLGTATISTVSSGTGMPAVNNANQEAFLIATRIDALDGTKRVYFRNGTAINDGQTVRLGAAGSSGGGGSATTNAASLVFAYQTFK
jgi:hypothetical protein